MKSHAGTSLIEVLISVFILATVTVAITGLSLLTTRSAIESERKSVASALAQEELETIHAYSYNQVAFTDDQPAGLLTREKEVLRNNTTYTVTTHLELADDPANGTLEEAPTLETADYKNLIIKVAWDKPSGATTNNVVAANVVVPERGVTQEDPGGGGGDSCAELFNNLDGGLPPATEGCVDHEYCTECSLGGSGSVCLTGNCYECTDQEGVGGDDNERNTDYCFVSGVCFGNECDCLSGQCVECDQNDVFDTKCVDKVGETDYCKASTHTCVECITNAHCDPDQTCTNNECIDKCGNGQIDEGEQCDGANLGGATCQAVGYPGGQATCTDSCELDDSGCWICGDGLCTENETVASCPEDCQPDDDPDDCIPGVDCPVDPNECLYPDDPLVSVCDPNCSETYNWGDCCVEMDHNDAQCAEYCDYYYMDDPSCPGYCDYWGSDIYECDPAGYCLENADWDPSCPQYCQWNGEWDEECSNFCDFESNRDICEELYT